jgi:hypothetical protein
MKAVRLMRPPQPFTGAAEDKPATARFAMTSARTTNTAPRVRQARVDTGGRAFLWLYVSLCRREFGYLARDCRTTKLPKRDTRGVNRGK